AALLDELPCLLEGLTAVDALLDRRVEVLDAHADAVEAEPGEGPDLADAGDCGVDLDRRLDASRPGQTGLDRLREPGELIRIEVRRRPSPEVDLDDLRTGGQQGANAIELQLHRAEVSLDERLAPGDEHVAAAVVAEVPAERDVDVDGCRTRARAAERLPGLGLAERPLPVVGGGIAGVAGDRDGPVPLEQRVVYPHGFALLGHLDLRLHR